MSMSVSSDIMSSAISAPQSASRPPPPPGGGGKAGPPDHATAIATMGGSLTDEIKDSLLAGVAELEESGASFKEIKAFVDSELEANGVDVTSEHQRSGQLVDMMS